MASIQHRRAELYGLEVKALSGAWQDISDTPSEAEVETSKAISAKRQADALERIAAIMEGEIGHPEWGIAPTLRQIQNDMR